MRYIFVLGREHELALAEIAAVAAQVFPTIRPIVTSRAVAVVEVSEPLDVAWWQKRLGGTIKIAAVHTTIPAREFKADLDTVGALIADVMRAQIAHKIQFGYSVYDGGGEHEPTGRVRTMLRTSAPEQKEWLQDHGFKVRWVTSRELTLSSVVVAKNLLLPKGVEILVAVTPSEIFLGRTISVQPFEEWGERDFGRPARDAKVGMLPPKLARIMVNLAQVPAGGVVFDPFCGSGTVLMEAILAGYRAIGSDIDLKGIERTKQNLTWLEEHNPNVRGASRAFACDVRDVAAKVKGETIDAIVAEPYLGPPNIPQDEAKAQVAMQQVREILTLGLRAAASILKHGKRLVIVVPCWHVGARLIDPGVANLVKTLSLKMIPPPAGWLKSDDILHFERPGQHVVRRIVIFEKV